MHRKMWSLVCAGLLIAGMLAACTAAPPPTPQVVEKVVTSVVEKQNVVTKVQTQVVEKEKVVVATPVPAPPGPKTIRINLGTSDLRTMDPALVAGTREQWMTDMTTVGLTRQDELTGQAKPGLASKWDISPDGKTYTFHLRNDVPWVKWDEAQGKVVKVQDCDGKDRMVTANDIEYGILRELAPKTASEYAFLLAGMVEGAGDYNSGKITDTKKVGVKAIDPQTLEIKFNNPAAYNAMVAGTSNAHAQPKWIIEGDDCTQARGDRWTETGLNQGYGPYTMQEWVHDTSLTLVKNPYWPGTEAVPQAKIDVIVASMLDDGPAFAEYEAGNLDVATVPLSDLDRVKADPTLSKEMHVVPSLCAYYYGFNTKGKYVDDVRLRKALSQAIDRKALVDAVIKTGEPAQWWARPGLAGAPTMQDHPDLGVKYDPAEAKKQLDAYLQDKGLTADKLDLTLAFNQSSAVQSIAEAVQQMWKTNLGLKVNLAAQENKTYWPTVRDPKSGTQIFRGSFCQDYPDANNFHKDLFGVDGNANPAGGGGINWNSPAYEDLLKKAAQELDPAKRVELYAQAEDLLVNKDAVIAPLYWRAGVSVTKPNVQRTYSTLGATEEIEKWDITGQ